MKRPTAATALFLGLLALAAAPARASDSLPEGPLPETAQPLHYALHLTLDPAADGFQGEARVRVRLTERTDHVWLHGRGLNVETVHWTGADGKGGEGHYQQRNEEGVARLDFDAALPAQELELEFRYSGVYSRTLEGVYKVQRGGDSYLVTQFEDVAARRAFPSFDQPSFKTPFDLSLTVPERLTVVANSRQIGDERDVAGLKTVRFATTAPLPAYLVAFAVGPFDSTELVHMPATAVRHQPLHLRVLGPRGSRPQLDYALKTTPAIVTALEDYFGSEFPFDKLDLLAAPDFAFGAMENAGLIVFREQYLLLDARSPAKAQQDYLAVNAHEIAHQWFGDDVTLRWWDDTWLNESFANWMESKIIDGLYPDFHVRVGALDETLMAMREDSLASARRVREPVLRTADIGTAFDAITYQKGGGVLAMFESWLGPEAFREGVRRYVRTHARGGATAADLFSALDEASGKQGAVNAAMRSFIEQPGVPYLHAQLACSGKTARLKLRQSRYLPLGSTAKTPARWQVPVCVRLGHGAASDRQCMLLAQREESLTLLYCPDWYMPNAGGDGYYRYAMPAADLARLQAHLGALTPREQVAHADSLSAAFHRGELAPGALLDSAAALAQSPSRPVALAPVDDLGFMLDHLSSPAAAEALRKWIAAIYQPQLDRLGYAARENEAPDDARLRQDLAKFLALRAYSPPARDALLAIGRNILQASTPQHLQLDMADAGTLGSALALLVQEGGEAMVRRLMAELAHETNPAQRVALLQALAAAGDPASAALIRDWSIGGSLQLREMSALYSGLKAQPINRAPFWDWVQKNFSAVAQRYPAFAQDRIPHLLAEGMCSESEAKSLQAFLAPRLDSIAGAHLTLPRQLEAIRLCAALARPMARRQLDTWLAQQNIPALPASLSAAIASARRDPAMRARDLYRHPRETLEFFGLQPGMSVAEVWPAPGWYADILGPYLRQRGHYIAAGYAVGPQAPDWRKEDMRDLRAKFGAAPELYGPVAITQLGLPDQWRAAPPGSVDLLLTFRNVHNWIAGGYENEMFKAFYAALKPGGVLGVVEHRAPEGTDPSMVKQSGYVTESQVISLARAAGFELAARSDVNANPRDTRDYADGVWTLPPTLKLGAQDRDKYLAIGESDRMTLKFVKPTR